MGATMEAYCVKCKGKTESAKNFGRPYNEVMKETKERYFNDSNKKVLVKEFEPV